MKPISTLVPWLNLSTEFLFSDLGFVEQSINLTLSKLAALLQSGKLGQPISIFLRAGRLWKHFLLIYTDFICVQSFFLPQTSLVYNCSSLNLTWIKLKCTLKIPKWKLTQCSYWYLFYAKFEKVLLITFD